MIKCNLKLSNPECFTQWIESRDDAFRCAAIELRYLHFSVLPRKGESIIYPVLSRLDESLARWLHRNIRLTIIDVIYNPLKVTGFGDNPDTEILHGEFEIILIVEAINKALVL